MSRIKQRIPLFLARLDIEKLVLKLWHTTEDKEDSGYRIDLQIIIETVRDKDFEELWINNPDLRFGQLMVNEGFNIFDAIYNLEESDILVEYCGLSRPESYIWGSNYNEDGSMRQETLYRFIDELDDKHLATMVDEANGGDRYYSPNMVDIFVEELHRRGFVNYRLTDEGREKLWMMGDELNHRKMIEVQEYIRTLMGRE